MTPSPCPSVDDEDDEDNDDDDDGDISFGFESRSPALSSSDEEMEDAPPAARDEAESQVAQAGGAGNPSDEPESLVAPPPSSRGGGIDGEDDDDMSVPVSAPSAAVALVAPLATSIAGALLMPNDLAALPCYRCFRAAFSGSGPLAAPTCIFVGGSLRCAHVSCRGKGSCRPVRLDHPLQLGKGTY